MTANGLRDRSCIRRAIPKRDVTSSAKFCVAVTVAHPLRSVKQEKDMNDKQHTDEQIPGHLPKPHNTILGSLLELGGQEIAKVEVILKTDEAHSLCPCRSEDFQTVSENIQNSVLTLSSKSYQIYDAWVCQSFTPPGRIGHFHFKCKEIKTK